MTPCEDLIRKKISEEGPLSIESFMELALHHPTHGYYTKARAIGKEGDFITAPEVSQMFGEVIGAWCVNMWQQLGSPEDFNLIELGPGRGTLMTDILRVGQNGKGFLNAMNLILVEQNQTLRKQQEEKLADHTLTWVEDFSEISLGKGPNLIIANEFFDAFPVQQFSQVENQWFEKHVTLANDQFQLVDLESKHVPSSQERSPQAETYFGTVCETLKKSGGAILVIDYGYEEGQGHTLQAMNHHDFTSPLSQVGETDLTAHVNFRVLQDISVEKGLLTSPLLTQGRFLTNLGILERSQQLQSQNPFQIPQIISELMRLTHPQQMGSLFKVLCAYTPSSLQPEGFQ